jgi:hypothetical protein
VIIFSELSLLGKLIFRNLVGKIKNTHFYTLTFSKNHGLYDIITKKSINSEVKEMVKGLNIVWCHIDFTFM